MLLCVHSLFIQGNLNYTEWADSDFPWRTEMENESHNFKIAVQWQDDLLILKLHLKKKRDTTLWIEYEQIYFYYIYKKILSQGIVIAMGEIAMSSNTSFTTQLLCIISICILHSKLVGFVCKMLA